MAEPMSPTKGLQALGNVETSYFWSPHAAFVLSCAHSWNLEHHLVESWRRVVPTLNVASAINSLGCLWESCSLSVSDVTWGILLLYFKELF